MGQPCPFLGEDKRCSIYEVRPTVCRGYSCREDPRITPGVRAGTEVIMYSDAHVAKVQKEEEGGDE